MKLKNIYTCTWTVALVSVRTITNYYLIILINLYYYNYSSWEWLNPNHFCNLSWLKIITDTHNTRHAHMLGKNGPGGHSYCGFKMKQGVQITATGANLKPQKCFDSKNIPVLPQLRSVREINSTTTSQVHWTTQPDQLDYYYDVSTEKLLG